ncbi:MAG: hypothetical protein II803_08140 [Firmicutes bacterium]|nr:hypothetical protein [Bacillota bacterium]
MIRIHEIKVRPGDIAGLSSKEKEALLAERAERRLRLRAGSLVSVRIAKESIDSRRKPEIFWVYSLDAEGAEGDGPLLAAAERAGVKAAPVRDESFTPEAPSRAFRGRPVVAGFGPCGIFAGLVLAMNGLRPVILERGSRMDRRIEAVERFWESGELSALTNVQFGEGGAGTFSDGKLTTGTRDPANRFVLESFVEAGADPAILYRQRAHLGTDALREIVVRVRERIESLGGEIRFETSLAGLRLEDSGGQDGLRVAAALLGDGTEIETDTVILATGHSARDTVRELYREGLLMERKPFSMGVRIEHPQELIDRAQYGAPHAELGLPPADYRLHVKTSSGRGVYTFCMCPGGYVVASASEEGGLVTNGMSNAARDAENANSALLADVRPSDFPGEHPLAGIELQEKYERLAFELGGGTYKAPVMRVGEFLGTGGEWRAAGSAKRGGTEAASPSYRPGTVSADIRKCLPDFVSEALAEALPMLGRQLEGFDDPDAPMTALESRSSAPFRILRGDDRMALSREGRRVEGLFPGGEGAGYAGGIMSAAADGVRLAEAAGRLRPSDKRS